MSALTLQVALVGVDDAPAVEGVALAARCVVPLVTPRLAARPPDPPLERRAVEPPPALARLPTEIAVWTGNVGYGVPRVMAQTHADEDKKLGAALTPYEAP